MERNRRLVRGTVDAVWNTETPAARTYLTDDFVLHASGAPDDLGPEAHESYVSQFRDALDGFSLDVQVDVAEGDRVALLWRATGRHVGRLFGVEPTGERVTVRGIEIARVEPGPAGDPVIAEAWVTVDDPGFVWGLDATPAGPDVPVPKAPATPVVTDLRSARETRELGVAHAERLWGDHGHAADVATRVVGRDHVFRRAGDDIEGRDAYVALVESYRAAFPDLRVSVRDVVAEGDRVVVRAAMTGCHEGEFEGVEPTGRRVEAHWTFLHEVADGRIVATGMADNHRWLLEQVSARPLSATDSQSADDRSDTPSVGG